jgi:hypothetical protein
MKNLIIAILLVLISSSIYSQTKIGTGFYSNGHDSLLFDGTNSSFIIASNICKVKVQSVSGIAIGTRCVLKIYNTCGEKDTAEECKVGQIFPDDKLKAGDKISTGPNGYLSIMLSDGKTINLAPNTSIYINSNYCENNFKTQVQLDEGLISINARPNKDVKGINVSTEYGTAITEGTEFSYEIIKESGSITDVLKVFEGTVKFQKNMQNKANQNKTEDKAAEMKKLTEDFQNGKISQEEYMKKIQEIQKEATESLKYEVTVNAGFLSRIVGTENPTQPESFDVNENHWWENK